MESNDIFALLIADSIWLAVVTASTSVRLGSTNSLTNFSMSLSRRLLWHSVLLCPENSQTETVPASYHQSWASNSQLHLSPFLRNYFWISKGKTKIRGQTFSWFFLILSSAISSNILKHLCLTLLRGICFSLTSSQGIFQFSSNVSFFLWECIFSIHTFTHF